MPNLTAIVLAALLAGAGTSRGDDEKPEPPPEQQSAAARRPTTTPTTPPEESVWQKLLRVAGISATPSTLKAPGDDLASGELWLVDLETGTPRRLTAVGGYRSPIFEPGAETLLALSGDQLVRIPLLGGEPRRLQQTRAVKLVGFVAGEARRVLIVLRDDTGQPVAAFLSLDTGDIEALALDRDSNQGRRMLHHLQGWERIYSTAKLYIRRQTKRGLVGAVDWTDVFIKRDASDPVNVSRCDGIDCGQPSLSPDGGRVVFVKSAP